MDYDAALGRLREWVGDDVVVRLDPEGTVLRGRLSERDPEGIDGALFVLDAERLTGVAFALFRDGVDSAHESDGALVVRQGKVTITVARAAAA